jgi:hypothetical protein
MKVSSLRGRIEYSSLPDISCSAVSRIYHDGEPIYGEITPDMVEEDTYLLKAVGINGSLTELKVYEVVSLDNVINLQEYDMHCKGIKDYLLIAIRDIVSVCKYCYDTDEGDEHYVHDY